MLLGKSDRIVRRRCTKVKIFTKFRGNITSSFFIKSHSFLIVLIFFDRGEYFLRRNGEFSPVRGVSRCPLKRLRLVYWCSREIF